MKKKKERKCRFSGPTPDLQNLHFSKILREFSSQQSLRSMDLPYLRILTVTHTHTHTFAICLLKFNELIHTHPLSENQAALLQ